MRHLFNKSSVLAICFLVIYQKGISQYNLMANDLWYKKVVKAISIIKRADPFLYEEIITKAYIQAGMLNETDDMGNGFQKCGISILENRNEHSMPWILINSVQLDKWNLNKIAGVILHEALHLKFWNYGVDGKYYSYKSESDMYKEHTYIYNYQLQFLKKIHAPEKDLVPCTTTMDFLNIPITK